MKIPLCDFFIYFEFYIGSREEFLNLMLFNICVANLIFHYLHIICTELWFSIITPFTPNKLSLCKKWTKNEFGAFIEYVTELKPFFINNSFLQKYTIIQEKKSPVITCKDREGKRNIK